MKKFIKILLGIIGVGTITTAGVITGNKIIENKEGNNLMVNIVGNTIDKNEISEENINDENTTVETVEQDNNVEVQETENKNEEKPKTTASPKATVKEQNNENVIIEKEITCIVNVKEIAEDQGWEKHQEANTIEIRVDGKTIYKNTKVDYANNDFLTIPINGTGEKLITLIAGGITICMKDLNFNTQTSISLP